MIGVCVLVYRLYIDWFFKIDLLYNIDKSKAVDITKDIIYKNTKDKSLPMDIYKPAGITKETKLPTIIFVHGEGTERIIGNAKDWNFYRSYGKFAASNNFIGVTFNRSRMNLHFKNAQVKRDIFDAVDFVRKNAEEFNIDKDRICIWGYSLGGLYVSLFIKNAPKYIKCLISYYGLHDISTRTKAFNKEYEDYYPENYLPGDFADIPPLLIVKAEKDKVKGVNKSIDKLISIAKARNLKFEYIVHSTGKHAFDALNDNDETRVVIDKTLQFIKKNI